MGLLSIFKNKSKRSKMELEESVTLANFSDSLVFGQYLKQAQSSRSLSAVFACVQLISNALSCMPLRVMKVDECGHKEVVKHHPLQRIFRNKNIQTMGMHQIIKNVIEDVLTHGQGFIFVNRGVTGLINSLRYIPYSSMTVRYDEIKDTISYLSPLLGNKWLDSKEVIHIKDITRDGVNGQSILAYARQVMDLARSAEDAAAEFFNSGCNVNGIISLNQPLNDRQRNEIKSSWNSAQGKKALQILPFGVNYSQIGTDASKSQLLESRQYELTEICRYFGVSPLLIGDLTHSTFNNIQEVNLQFVQYTLMPFIKEIEEEFTRKIFYDDDNLIVDMDEQDFLRRADLNATAEYYNKMVTSGILSINDARRDLGLSDIKGGDDAHIAYSDAEKARISNNEQTAEEEKINTEPQEGE